jgi:hypothetical protein
MSARLSCFRTVALVGVAMLSALPGRAELPEPANLPVRPEFPDPLVMLDGQRVTSKEQWLTQRRPELKQLFQHYMYGYFPAAPAKVEAKVERIDPQALGGKATLKEITLSLGGPDIPKLHLLLIVPNHRSKPAPVFVGMNFHGNHALLADPKIALPTRTSNKKTFARGSDVDVWAIEQTIDSGYAVATLFYGDAVLDDAKARASGIQPHFGKGGNEPGSHDWGAIAAWAWALERVID